MQRRAEASGINLRLLDDDTGVVVALDETVTTEELAVLAALLGWSFPPARACRAWPRSWAPLRAAGGA